MTPSLAMDRDPARTKSPSTRTILYVTAGPGLATAPHGDLFALDWDRKEIVEHLRCPLEIHAASHKGLAGASRAGDRLWLANEGEILEVATSPLRILRRITHPCFNDVHHVCESAGRLWVCNSGLDSVEEFDLTGKHLTTHELIGPFGRGFGHVAQLLWNDATKSLKRLGGRFKHYAHLGHRPPFRNLRKLVSYRGFRASRADWRHSDLRPHVLHPNHLLPVGDDLWVTLWRTGEIVSLKTRRVMASGLGNPHDGVFCGDDFYVTDCKANRLLAYVRRPDGTLQLRKETCVTGHLTEGFLRGAWAIGDRIFTALTARRGAPPEYRQGRILALDRSTLAVRDVWTVPAELGSGLFTLLPA